MSKQDVLTDDTARQILAHDKTWRAICGTPASAKPKGQ